MNMSTVGLPAMAAAVVSLAIADLASASAPEIRIAIVGSATQPLNVLFNDDFYINSVLENYGDKYRVTITRAESTPVAAQLLIAGQVDIATLSAPAMSNMVLRGIASRDDMKIIGAGITDGYTGHVSTFWAALETSEIAGPEDMAGKIVAINGFGTNSDAALRTMLSRAGLNPDADLQIVELAFPNMQNAMEQGRVDVAQFTVPFSSRLRAAGGARELFSFVDAFGGPSYSTVKVVMSGALESRRAAFEAFLEDYSRGLHWLVDPGNREEAIEATSRASAVPVAALQGFYLTENDQGFDPDLCVNGNWLQTPLEQLLEQGVLTEVVDLRSMIDLTALPNQGATCR